MNTSLKPLIACLPALLSTSHALAQPVAAAPASLQSDSTLPSITVYASRFAEPMNDALPQISIVSGVEIQKSGASNVSEVLSRVAGLTMRVNLDGSTNAVVDMRGYGDTASNNVVILLDGVRLSDSEQSAARTSMIPLEAIDHIEISKTGNGVLFGDGATGGTVNIVTRRSVGNLTVITGGLASYSGLQSGLFHSQVLEKGELSLFMRQYASDNYRQNSKGTELSAGANWIMRIDPQTDIGARLFTSQERNKLPGALPSIHLNTAPRETQVPGYNYDAAVDSTSLTLFGKKEINDYEFAIDLNKRQRNNRDSYSYDARDVYVGYNTYPDWYQSYSKSSAQMARESISPRLKVKKFILQDNTLQVGYDWQKSGKSGEAYKTDSGYDPVYWPFKIDNSNYQLVHRTKGLYARNIWDVTSADRIVVGYRSERYSQNYFMNLYNDNDLNVNPGTTSYLSEGRASASELEYSKKLQDNLVGYLRWSSNFRIANVDDNVGGVQGDYIPPNWYPKPLSVQKSRDIDIGLNYRTSFGDTELGYFQSSIRNEIGFDPALGGNVNYHPTRRQGLNLRQKLAITKEFAVRANLQYVNARFVEGLYADKIVPGVATLSGNLTLDYLLRPGQQLAFTTRFAASRYMSGDFDNSQLKVPGYAVQDLSYAFKEKNWSVVASILNITNKKYTDVGIYKASYTAPYNLTVYPNPGRSFSLTGRYAF
jgi:iron complex outermembrane recepter protein